MIATQPNDDPTEDSNAHLYEQSLGRLASALGGEAVLPPTFQFIPSMLAAHDWRPRHAGLMAIAAIIQGTFEVRKLIAEQILTTGGLPVYGVGHAESAGEDHRVSYAISFALVRTDIFSCWQTYCTDV